MRLGNIKWKLAVSKLEETLKLDEELFLNNQDDNAGVNKDPRQFENTLKLYMQYLGVLKELDEIYNDTVHPQKRESIKKTEVMVVSRIIQLRHYFVRVNPSYIRSMEKSGGGKNSCPPLMGWEYTNINFHHFSPQFKFKWNASLLPTIPTFFKDKTSREGMARDQRDTLVRGYVKLKSESDTKKLQTATSANSTCKSPTDDESGVAPSSPPLVVKKPGNNDSENIILEDYSESEINRIDHRSSTIIQKFVRGFLVRNRCKNKESLLLSMIGMKHPQNLNHQQKQHRDTVRLKELDEKKKFQQTQNEIRYKDAVTELKDEVRRDKGFGMKQFLRSMRIQWATEKINETNQVPDSMSEFYKSQNMGEGADLGEESTSPTNKISSLVSSLKDDISNFSATWKDPSFEGGDLFDEGLARDIAQKEIEKELQKDVDEQLLSNFKRIKSLSSNGTSKSTKKGDKSKSKKKSKGKKKKEKPLPGDKIAELKGIDTGHIVSILVAEDLLKLSDDFPLMKDFICLEESDSSMAKGKESNGADLPYPNLLQVKRLVTEYCVMPMGCLDVRKNLADEQFIRSLLLYGPRGSGKALLASAVANELGALFIDFSPKNIPEKFQRDKIAATKLIHMVFTLAKDSTFAPIVIYIGNCEIFLLSTKKKKGIDTSFASKFQKELLIYKNQALNKERVIIIGSSSSPWDGDLKQMKWKGPGGKPDKQGFWEHFLYIQNPTYVERSHLWKHFIKQQLSDLKRNTRNLALNYNVLSQFSEGYSAGAIEECVKSKLSMDILSKAQSEEMEEILLSTIKATSPKDTTEAYRKFTVDCMTEEKGKNKTKKKKK